jgi:hypothetical protein
MIQGQQNIKKIFIYCNELLAQCHFECGQGERSEFGSKGILEEILTYK